MKPARIGPLALAIALAAGSCSDPPPWSGQSAAPAATAPGQQRAANAPATRAGECYARVQVPPQIRTRRYVVEVTPAGERIETVPAVYVWEERRYEVAPARQTLRVIPAKLRWVEERELVEPELAEMRALPARVETRRERVMIAPARQVWRPGRGAVERIDEDTGRYVHRVELPARYQIVTRTVEVAPAREERVVLRPAVYRTVRRAVVEEPARTVTVDIPAQYETVRIRTLARPESQRRVPVPAVTKRVTERIEEAPARVEWRAILCANNATPQVVAKVQRELARRGFDPGPPDGRMSPRTAEAVRLYQHTHGLARGPLTRETLDHLGVTLSASAD